MGMCRGAILPGITPDFADLYHIDRLGGPVERLWTGKEEGRTRDGVASCAGDADKLFAKDVSPAITMSATFFLISWLQGCSLGSHKLNSSDMFGVFYGKRYSR